MLPVHHRFKKMPEAFIRAFGSDAVFYTTAEDITIKAILREQSEDVLVELGSSGLRTEGAFVAVQSIIGSDFPENTRILYEGVFYKISSPPLHDGRGMTQYSIIKDGDQS